MISFSAPVADMAGAILLEEHEPETRLDEPISRVSRTKTLDGGVHIEHNGISEGDRTFTVSVRSIDDAQYAVLDRLFRLYTSILVSCREGLFSGTIESLMKRKGGVTVKVLIRKKLA